MLCFCVVQKKVMKEKRCCEADHSWTLFTYCDSSYTLNERLMETTKRRKKKKLLERSGMHQASDLIKNNINVSRVYRNRNM